MKIKKISKCKKYWNTVPEAPCPGTRLSIQQGSNFSVRAPRQNASGTLFYQDPERPITSNTFLLRNNNWNISGNNNNTSMLSSNLMYKNTMNNCILDENEGNKLKWKLILTKYINSEENIDIVPLPYDSHFIEVHESR